MHYTVKIMPVYNSILDETKLELVTVRGTYEKTYVGPLFFEIDPFECLKGEAVTRIVIPEATAEEIILAAYGLLADMDKLHKGTLKTMAHWQYVNGVTTEMLTECYNYKTDEEYLSYLMKKV